MKRLFKHLEIVYKAVNEDDWDAVYAVVGDEGYSKSTLCLHIVDWWYTQKNGKCISEDVKHIALDKEQFVVDLNELKQGELGVWDEAGELNARSALSSLNRSMMKAYQVIRGVNLVTLLVLPSLWDLDPFFRNRRVRGVFFVYKRGRFGYIDRDRLRKMLALNENRSIRYAHVAGFTYHDTFPKYKGVLKEAYDLKKTTKMNEIRQDLVNEVTKKDEEAPSVMADRARENRDKVIFALAERGFRTSEIADLTDLSMRTVQSIIKKRRREGSVTS